MKFAHLCLISKLLTLAVSAQELPEIERLAFWSWGTSARLKAELRAIDDELTKLPQLAVVNTSASTGFKTALTIGENVRWLAVELAAEAVVDTVVLAPALAKAATGVVAGYGFPVRFMLEAFDAAGQVAVVLDASREDFPNPGCYPVIARFEPRRIKRVRLTALEPWDLDGAETLAMAELLILSGNRNLAVGAKVTCSSTRAAPRTWTRPNLVDWITPMGLPVRPEPSGAPGFHSAVSQTADVTKHVTVSLREPMLIDEVWVVPARVKAVPLWFDYGFPQEYKVEGALNEDFSDAILLGECTDRYQPLPGMNLVVFPVGGRKIQHVRFTAKRLWLRQKDYVFALAELALMRDGVNVALGAEVTASDQSATAGGMTWAPQQLTDGLTAEGRLIPLPDWFSQLERRRLLESKRSGLVQQIDKHMHIARKQVVYASIGGLGGASFLSILLLVRQRQQRRRDARRIQEKLARDLHDEIGSNLGSIAMISSLANEPNTTPESLRADLAEIGLVAAESADSMRDMVQLINPRTHATEPYWLAVIQRLTERLLRGIDTTCDFPAQPLRLEPDPEARREIYLLCKEALHNISRHSRASKATIRIAPSEKGLQVLITDNGVGFDSASRSAGHGIGNMQERAGMIGARLQLTSKPGTGTTVQFDVPAPTAGTAPDYRFIKMPDTTTSASPIRVWIVEDHATYRRSIERLCTPDRGLAPPCAFSNGEEMLTALKHEGADAHPEVMLLDVGLPGRSGLDLIQDIHQHAPHCRIVILTVFEDEEKICEAIRSGASGYLLKTAGAEEVAKAILEADAGGSPMSPSIASRVVSLLAKLMKPMPEKVALSPRETELLTLMVEGLTAKEIADRMSVSIHTTGTHTKNLFAKLEVHSRAAAVARALRDKLV